MHSKNKLKKPEDGIFTNIYHCKGLIMILILFNISEIKGNCKEKIQKKIPLFLFWWWSVGEMLGEIQSSRGVEAFWRLYARPAFFSIRLSLKK